MKVEQRFIDSMKDSVLQANVFTQLLNWMIEVTQREVVIFDNGNVLLTSDWVKKLDSITRQMLCFFLKPAQFYVGSNQVIEKVLLGLAPVIEEKTIIKKNEYYVLTDAQEDIRYIISYAVEHDISDIHIEIRKEQAKIKCRKYGVLFQWQEWSADRAMRMCFVSFNKESDDVKKHFNSLIPHDASMELFINGRCIRIRLASIPAYPYPSLDVVFRILALGHSEVTDLDQLGYSEAQREQFRRAMMQRNGAIVIAGSTGSGKTTSLAALVNLLPDSKKVYMIEDPVEKKLNAATQIPTNADNPLCTFDMLTRQTLRMDPDCIVIGEVRDENTAKMMARASITGHLVLSTIHANSAVNIITRLKDLGITSSFLLDPHFLSLICYQVLLRKLCDQCKQLSNNVFHRHCFGEIYTLGNDLNCTACLGTGVMGRIAVAEMIALGDREFEYIQNQQFSKWIIDLELKQQNLKYHVIDLFKQGVVSAEDAELILGYIPEFYSSGERKR